MFNRLAKIMRIWGVVEHAGRLIGRSLPERLRDSLKSDGLYFPSVLQLPELINAVKMTFFVGFNSSYNELMASKLSGDTPIHHMCYMVQLPPWAL